MRELGAILGLTIGYIIKYKLDKRFVFRQKYHMSKLEVISGWGLYQELKHLGKTKKHL